VPVSGGGTTILTTPATDSEGTRSGLACREGNATAASVAAPFLGRRTSPPPEDWKPLDKCYFCLDGKLPHDDQPPLVSILLTSPCRYDRLRTTATVERSPSSAASSLPQRSSSRAATRARHERRNKQEQSAERDLLGSATRLWTSFDGRLWMEDIDLLAGLRDLSSIHQYPMSPISPAASTPIASSKSPLSLSASRSPCTVLCHSRPRVRSGLCRFRLGRPRRRPSASLIALTRP